MNSLLLYKGKTTKRQKIIDKEITLNFGELIDEYSLPTSENKISRKKILGATKFGATLLPTKYVEANKARLPIKKRIWLNVSGLFFVKK